MENGRRPFPLGTTFLVTGAAGFIGSNLVDVLLTMGYRVRGLDNFLVGRRENILPFKSNPLFDFIEGDIRDTQTCCHACQGVDYVLHQAALGSVKESINRPLLYEEINVGGTIKMMDAAVASGVRKFVYASSSSVYGDCIKMPVAEGEEGKPLSPYAVTKLSNEHYAHCYWLLFGLPTIGLRYFNIFGPRQDPNSEYAAVIPKFIAGLLCDQPVTIHGDGEQTRDFTHVNNVVEANILACLSTATANGLTFNIACGDSITVNRLYFELCNRLGKSSNPIYAEARVGDVRHSLADISKARQFLDYRPVLQFEEGISQMLSLRSPNH